VEGLLGEKGTYKVSIAASFEEDTDGWDKDGKDNLIMVSVVSSKEYSRVG